MEQNADANVFAPPAADLSNAGMSDGSSRTYAGFWIRFGAQFVDGLILGVVNIAVIFLLGGFSAEGGSSGAADAINNLIGIVYTLTMWTMYSATLGKMAVGVRIINAETGEGIKFGRALGRYFAMILSALPLGLGFLWAAWDKEKRTFHDMIAGTRVVK